MTYNVFSGTLNPTHFTSLLNLNTYICNCVLNVKTACHRRLNVLFTGAENRQFITL